MTHFKLAPILEGRRSQPHQLVEVLQDTVWPLSTRPFL
jgi:hypothetical protein